MTSRPPGDPGDPGERRDLRAELDDERAAKEHWRRVARQRSAAYDSLSRHPAVRTLLSLDRRLVAVRRPIAIATSRFHTLAARLALGVAAVGHRRGRLIADMESTVRSLPSPATDGRRITLVVVGTERAALAGAKTAHTVAVPAVGLSRDTVAAVRRAIDATDGDLVGVVLATTEPVDDMWLARLAAAVADEVVAAMPLLMHPLRPRVRATAHDGLVRSAGLTVDVTAGGVPVVVAAAAGTAAEPGRPASDVAAGSAACLLVDRTAYDRAGGLPVVDDLEIAAVELCTRLRAAGGRIVVVPSAVMVDQRAVRSRRELRNPIDPGSAGWRAAIDRSGPALFRSARPVARDVLRFAITVAAPSAEAAERWGDWHLANAFADALRRCGHVVRIQTAAAADDLAGRSCDVHCVVRGLLRVRRTRGQRHVLWIISHPDDVDDRELDEADLVLVASHRFAAELRTRTRTPVETMLQATDPARFRPLPPDPAHRHDVVIVAKSRGQYRTAVADAIASGLRPAIYGSGWEPFVDTALIADDYVENDDLARVYSSVGVLLNDHWETMREWGFVSNRVFDALACATPVISDDLPEIVELFGDAVPVFHDAPGLRMLVDDALGDPDRARARARRGRDAVLAHHTFDHRAREFLDALSRHDLVAPSADPDDSVR
jgi:hypothetical protein